MWQEERLLYLHLLLDFEGLPGGSVVKCLPAMQEPLETWVRSLSQERSPGGGHSSPLQYTCLKNPRGQRSLVGYSPWGHKESD